jgi:uncharacterized membrane protein HdeD (DUF308 family)
MNTHSLSDEIKQRSKWSIFMGVLTAALGVFLIVYPLAAGTMTTVLLGWALILVGIAQFVFAFHSQTVGNFFLRVSLSVLYGFCGIALAFFPIVGVAALTGIVGTLFLIQAGLQTAAALQLKPLAGWGWLLVDAGASLLLGIMIIAQWPFSSVWAIGTLVGVSVLMGGISRVMISAKIRSGAASVQRFVHGAA